MKRVFVSLAVASFAFTIGTIQAQEESPDLDSLNTDAFDLDGTGTTARSVPLPGGTSTSDVLAGIEEAEVEEKVEEFVLPDSVKNLSADARAEIQKLLQEAQTFIKGIRLQEGLQRLIEIEDISDEIYQTHNLRGAVYTRLRDFPKARVSFEKALRLSPNLMEAQFNLAEIDFVEKKFSAAEQRFRNLIKDHSGMGMDTRKLIEYKLFISLLQQSESEGDAKEQEAMDLLETFDYLDDWPVYYYSMAALHFHRDDQAEASGWLKSAENIYPKGVQAIYLDALVEMGWVESF